MEYEHDDSLRPTTRRARIIKVNDEKSQQRVDISGLKNEKPKEIWRPQPFGYSSVPPKDSDGVMIQMGSRSDRTLYLEGGHEKYRPKKTPEGGTVLFNHEGDIIRMFPAKVDVIHKDKINIRIGKGYDSGNSNAPEGDEDDKSSEDTKTISMVFDGDKIVIEYDGSKVMLEDGGKVTCLAATRFAGGVDGGKWVVAKASRIDLGVSGPDGIATPAVMTDAGPSSIVFAVI